MFVIFERSRIGLYVLPRYRRNTIKIADAELAGQDQVRAVAENQTGADGDDDVDDGRQLRLHAARLQRGVDVLPALPVETPLFVVFARERLDDLNGRQHFRDARQQLAFLSSERRVTPS